MSSEAAACRRITVFCFGRIIDSKNSIVASSDYRIKRLSIHADVAYSQATQVE